MSCDRICATCAWWSNVEPSLSTGLRRPQGADPEMGICTFSPPVVVGLAGMTVSRFPEILGSRGCGQWAESDGGGPDDGERIGNGDDADRIVVPFQKVAA